MSEARKIADNRLAKGEITPQEHAKIIAATDTAPPQNAGKDDSDAPKLTLNAAWMWLVIGLVIFLCVKASVDEVVASGEPVRWGLVYSIYAFCAFAVLGGLGGILGANKK